MSRMLSIFVLLTFFCNSGLASAQSTLDRGLLIDLLDYQKHGFEPAAPHEGQKPTKKVHVYDWNDRDTFVIAGKTSFFVAEINVKQRELVSTFVFPFKELGLTENLTVQELSFIKPRELMMIFAAEDAGIYSVVFDWRADKKLVARKPILLSAARPDPYWSTYKIEVWKDVIFAYPVHDSDEWAPYKYESPIMVLNQKGALLDIAHEKIHYLFWVNLGNEPFFTFGGSFPRVYLYDEDLKRLEMHEVPMGSRDCKPLHFRRSGFFCWQASGGRARQIRELKFINYNREQKQSYQIPKPHEEFNYFLVDQILCIMKPDEAYCKDLNAREGFEFARTLTRLSKRRPFSDRMRHRPVMNEAVLVTVDPAHGMPPLGLYFPKEDRILRLSSAACEVGFFNVVRQSGPDYFLATDPVGYPRVYAYDRWGRKIRGFDTQGFQLGGHDAVDTRENLFIRSNRYDQFMFWFVK